MRELKGQGGELRATIQITRKATGKVETYELVGRTTPEQHAAIMADAKRGRVHGTSGAMAGPGATLKNKEDEDDGHA